MNYKQMEEKLKKIKRVLELYKTTDTINEIIDITGYSRSRIQDYLRNDSKKYVDKDEYEQILKWLNNSKNIGNSNGGKISQSLHGYDKDEKGYFKGSGK